MEKALTQLKNDGLLNDWSDEAIVPGQSISAEIRERLESAEIVVFLMSNDFLRSQPCKDEWARARSRSLNQERLFRIPIILRRCPWPDFLEEDDVKALPRDGEPISSFDDPEEAWLQVYEGIKSVATKLRQSITPKEGFVAELEKTLFISETKITLSDTFVFLRLSRYGQQSDEEQVGEEIITNVSQLLSRPYSMVCGDDMSGKSALCKFLFLCLIKAHKPVLYIDLHSIDHADNDRVYQRCYGDQFDGNYRCWLEQPNKTLILDNLSPSARTAAFLERARNDFAQIIVTVSLEIFQSFYRDDQRFVDYQQMKIEPLTQEQQETLIRKRLQLTQEHKPVTDGYIDHVEDRINSIIISNQIVPRYPFFVLSIMQTYEAFMPNDMEISSYGHCYYVLILANLIKSGISRHSGEIDACLNFSEHLAYHSYVCAKNQRDSLNFERYIDDYREQFVIQTSTINRLTSDEFGIINRLGEFRSPYMFLFFLGRHFAKRTSDHSQEIADICEECHQHWNYMILLFVIHHTSDEKILEDIMIRTMCTLDGIEPATLDQHESQRFFQVISALPADIMSESSVVSERQKERRTRQNYVDRPNATEDESATVHEPLNDVYKVRKTNQLLGQILRNKFGSLKKDRIGEVLEVVFDGGLRLVNLVLSDEEEIHEMLAYIKKKHPNYDDNRLERGVRFLSFLWTMNNIEAVVHAINVPEIRETVAEVVQRKGTPAYELVGYFSLLDASEELNEGSRRELARLLRKHDNQFIQSVLSLRTQHYMNTHSGRAPIEQAFCSLLKIPYRHRHRGGEQPR